MKPEQENFDGLRRLLALKRHEQPPPGYFDRFSSQVIARIRAGEEEQRVPLWERLFHEVPWIQSLFGAFETKPAFAVAFGAAVCGVMIAGIIYSQSTGSTNESLVQVPIVAKEASPSFGNPPAIGLTAQAQNPMFGASTNPVIVTQPTGSLFDLIQPNAQPVSFQPHGN